MNYTQLTEKKKDKNIKYLSNIYIHIMIEEIAQ
mgnify:CR=1 FL=1